MNVLFIMADQLRWDHLGCSGHPYLKTPHLDALAQRGVRFANAFVNSGVCGPSRMSYYTGRYPITHGATWNRVPLSVGEVTLGEMLRASGLPLALAGKTHVMPDHGGLARLQLEGNDELMTLLERGGFEEIDRYDGHHAPGGESGYAAFLREHGYDSADPWTDHVISGVDAAGQVHSGWHMRNVHLPARVREEHSETAFMTDQAIAYMQRMGSRPWVLHLSYVKPHWPYMAPAPYHALYTADQCLPVVRHRGEWDNAHPVVAAYRQQEECVSFQRDDCIRTVRPAYQGLISQLDHHLGRLFDHMDASGVLGETLIVFTADHGDFLGDHWLGEKELFYDTVQKVPMIVVDPRTAADATRGQRGAALRRVGRRRADRARRAEPARAGAPPGRAEPVAVLARPLTRSVARLCLQRTRLQLPPRALGARQRRAPVPRLQPAHATLALRLLVGRARAVVRSRSRCR